MSPQTSPAAPAPLTGKDLLEALDVLDAEHRTFIAQSLLRRMFAERKPALGKRQAALLTGLLTAFAQLALVDEELIARDHGLDRENAAQTASDLRKLWIMRDHAEREMESHAARITPATVAALLADMGSRIAQERAHLSPSPALH